MEIIQLEQAKDLDKKQLQQEGTRAAEQLLDDGNQSPITATIAARKAAEFLTSYIKALDSATRAELLLYEENQTQKLGAVVSISSTGTRLDLEADPIYSDLKNRLKDREELLKLAHKSKDAIYDQYAAEVPKVPIKSQSREVLKVRL